MIGSFLVICYWLFGANKQDKKKQIFESVVPEKVMFILILFRPSTALLSLTNYTGFVLTYV